MKSSILDKIVIQKKKEINQLKKVYTNSDKVNLNSVFSFKNSLSKPGLNLIAEIKKASPSAGIIRNDFNPIELADSFINSGAQALSILTDEKFFLGHLDYLKQVSSKVSCPILRKDFILDPIQVKQSATSGANAILLILSILTLSQAQALIDCANECNLDVLIEVHDEVELEVLLKLKGVQIIGFNNRNLNTFKVDINHSIKMKQKLKTTHLNKCLFIAESGYKNKTELDQLCENKFNGVLIGEGLAVNKQLASYFKK
jgi:indole-3-glycerol phosphate synthase